MIHFVVAVPQVCVNTYSTRRVPTDREDASSMVTAGAKANTMEGNGRASRESGLLCSHSQTVHNQMGHEHTRTGN